MGRVIIGDTGITEITGAIAVVVSLVYLGLQIRDNAKVLRSQAHYNALSLAQRPMARYFVACSASASCPTWAKSEGMAPR